MPATLRSRPLPSLPTETHAHILSYCDAQTLGRASLVSLAFLEIASPHLYGHITITGLAKLNRLFYQDERVSSAPHLDRLLSLDQTRTFTFIDDATTFERSLAHAVVPLLPKRQSCPYPIQVDTLNVRLVYPGRDLAPHMPAVVAGLLNLFDPRHVDFSSTYYMERMTSVEFLFMDLRHVRWTRLKTLAVDGAVYGSFISFPFFANLPAQSVTLEFSLDQRFLAVIARLETWLIMELSGDLLALSWPQVKEIVINVRSDELADAFKQGLRRMWGRRRARLQPGDADRREAMIRYVVV